MNIYRYNYEHFVDYINQFEFIHWQSTNNFMLFWKIVKQKR